MMGPTGDHRSKKPMKEKICLIYDHMFRGADDPIFKNSGFWDEFFLLWANPTRIEECLREISAVDLTKIKDQFSKLTDKCIETIIEEENIRCVNAFQTLIGLISGITNRADMPSKYDCLCLIFGYEKVEIKIKKLVEKICFLLSDSTVPMALKTICMRFLLTCVTCYDNLHENLLIEFLLLNNIFESLIGLLSNAALRSVLGRETVLFIAFMINYNKYEGVNPYVVKLSILDDELALNGYSSVISTVLSQYNHGCKECIAATEPQGMFSSFTSIVGNMFVGDEDKNTTLEASNYDEGVLLALYEAVHLNRNFITTLTNMPTSPTSEPMPPNSILSNEHSPSSLLVSFLTYSSVIMQDLKSDRSQNAAKLCALIMTCITEDQYANSLMHDINMACRVPLFRAPMRHRKGAFDKHVPLRPLAATLLDLCSEFIVSHLMKKAMPVQLYFWMIGIIHRILCYQKKCAVRLNYEWRQLWNALGSLLRFLVTNESYLIDQVDVFLLCSKVITLLNLFVTFGDTFLPSPTSYDLLYYEMVRQSEAFDNLYSMVLRHAHGDGKFKEAAVKLGNQLMNVRYIIAHFRPKIDELGVGGVTEDEVLQVVRSHYDTLTLKLYENLDVYERYNEKMKEKSFITSLVKLLVWETKARLKADKIDHHSVLSQLSTIK